LENKYGVIKNSGLIYNSVITNKGIDTIDIEKGERGGGEGEGKNGGGSRGERKKRKKKEGGEERGRSREKRNKEIIGLIKCE
jgi:hypothetical protein